jgi:acetyl esterase/lipase
MKRILLIVLVITSFFSCKEKNTTPIASTIQAETFLNISYGADAFQKMDVYLPANRSVATTKVMILLHGGGWREGDKVDLQNFVGINFIDTVKKRLPEYAIFNINYRLSNGIINLFPTQETDVKSALQFIYNKSAEYLIGDKYVLMGASAGAHLAMLQAYKYNVPVKPKAVISFFGPSDLIDMYNVPAGGNAGISTILALTIGKTPKQDSLLYANSSPVNFITNTACPTLLLHGTFDPLVRPLQSIFVKDKLTALGVVNQYIPYAGKGHGDDWGNIGYSDAFTNIESFLKTNIK